jgi:hypothetical protein
MWKDHIFWKALGLMVQQIDAEYEASEGEVFSLTCTTTEAMEVSPTDK